jgi:adenylosuccinate synthase
MDVLNGFKEIKLCTGYDINGKTTDIFSLDLSDIEVVKPVYKTMPGWHEDINLCSTIKELPEEAKDYLRFVQDYLGVDLTILSTGPNRTETIVVS